LLHLLLVSHLVLVSALDVLLLRAGPNSKTLRSKSTSSALTRTR
jgi:hypothetical protein